MSGEGARSGAGAGRAPSTGRRRRLLGVALGAGYLAAMWLDAAGFKAVASALPLPLRFFTQVAELFPRAAEDAIEWRVKGWRCDLGRFEELETRPFFPIHGDDKENRLYRAMFFYHRERLVMESLDAYLTREQNRTHPDARIGGIMLLSLRIPLPPLGAAEPRYQRRAISDYPATVARRYWYVTSAEARTHRCDEPP